MLLTAVAAWSGLAWLVLNISPARPVAQIGAYVFAFTAVTASVALLAWLVIRPRLEQGRLRSPAGYLAHSMLLALIALFALWLQSLRVLTPTVALLLVGLYTFLELAVLFGTRGSIDLPLRRCDAAIRSIASRACTTGNTTRTWPTSRFTSRSRIASADRSWSWRLVRVDCSGRWPRLASTPRASTARRRCSSALDNAWRDSA